jgi:DNA modification methylase
MNKKNIKFKKREDIKRDVEFDHFNSYNEYIIFIDKCMNLISSKMKPNSSAYIFFASQYGGNLINVCKKYELRLKDEIRWHKINPAPKIRKTGYISSIENIYYFIKGKPTFNFLNQNDMHNFIETSICMGNERIKGNNGKNLHPTQKPEKVLEKLILISSNPGDLILDCFAGTGTTGVVAKYLKRNYILIEKLKKYYDCIENRLKSSKTFRKLENFTKKQKSTGDFF